MNKFKIIFKKVEDMFFLYKTASVFFDDVNIYEGENVIDAKDEDILNKLMIHKEYNIELMSDYFLAQSEFKQLLGRLVIE